MKSRVIWLYLLCLFPSVIINSEVKLPLQISRCYSHSVFWGVLPEVIVNPSFRISQISSVIIGGISLLTHNSPFPIFNPTDSWVLSLKIESFYLPFEFLSQAFYFRSWRWFFPDIFCGEVHLDDPTKAGRSSCCFKARMTLKLSSLVLNSPASTRSQVSCGETLRGTISRFFPFKTGLFLREWANCSWVNVPR